MSDVRRRERRYMEEYFLQDESMLKGKALWQLFI